MRAGLRALGSVRRTAGRLPAVVGSPLLPSALLGVVGACDLALRSRQLPVTQVGLLDWSGHLATAGLMLLAGVGPRRLRRHPRRIRAVLAGAVLIDLDHLPVYAGLTSAGRPFTHSLATPAVLALCWLLTGRRFDVLAALSVGVLLHYVRDIATGSGLPLRWPLGTALVRVPYPVYLAALTGCAAAATFRAAQVRLGSG